MRRSSAVKGRNGQIARSAGLVGAEIAVGDAHDLLHRAEPRHREHQDREDRDRQRQRFRQAILGKVRRPIPGTVGDHGNPKTMVSIEKMPMKILRKLEIDDDRKVVKAQIRATTPENAPPRSSFARRAAPAQRRQTGRRRKLEQSHGRSRSSDVAARACAAPRACPRSEPSEDAFARLLRADHRRHGLEGRRDRIGAAKAPPCHSDIAEQPHPGNCGYGSRGEFPVDFGHSQCRTAARN